MAEKEVLPRLVRAAELRLGDVVRLFGDGYGDATVQEVGPMVHLFRVYVAAASFSCSGSQSDRWSKPPVESSSVITTIGHELVKITRDDPEPRWNLIRRGDVDRHEAAMRAEREKQETLERRYTSLRVHLCAAVGLDSNQIDALAERYDYNGRIRE